MRRVFKAIALGLATAALIVATPIQAVASAPVTTAPMVGMQATNMPTSSASVDAAATSATAADVGGGLTELYCAACVGAATYALFTGGTVMLPLFLANPEVVGTMTATCIYACRSVISEMLK